MTRIVTKTMFPSKKRKEPVTWKLASKGWHQSIDSAGGRTGRVSPHGKQFRFLDDIHGGDDEDVKAGLDSCAAYLMVPN